MKHNFKHTAISALLTLAMLLGVFAMTPLTAFAIDRSALPAETIYVGGVELGLGQYVKNGETTATTGEPAEDESGFAWYTPDGTLILVDYTYTGKGYEYSSGNYALIYSTGKLYITGGGVSTLKQTQSNNMGIYSVGSLTIATTGTLAIEGDNCSCLYSNNEITFTRYLGKVNLKSTGNATAIVSYDNDGDALDEEAIIVKGGDIYVETFYPISDLTINYGALTVSSPQYSLSAVPDISNYDGNYTLTVSENEDGSNPTTYNQDTITTFDPGKIDDYKYLKLAPPAKTVINSVSVSDIDLPEIGESFVYPDETALTYGGEYLAVGCWIEKYTGTEWIYIEDTEVIEHSVKYRYVLALQPNADYTFPEDITDDDVKINEKDSVVLMTFPDDAFTTMVEVALEFSYDAPVTDYGITIAKKNGAETVGVLITEENYTDVLGDGTVSYDPTTNTLTLNNYVYNGEGWGGDDVPCAITADTPIEGLTIVLVGTNSITVSGSAGMAFFGGGGLTVKGNGSLVINAGAYGIVLVESSDGIKIDGGNIDITTTEAMSVGIMALDFVMTSGDLKITASTIGIGTSKIDGICINGGSVEIGTAVGGYAFIYLDNEHATLNPVKPDTSNYVGAYKMTAGVNADGSDATDFNEVYLNSYKYVKVEPAHVHDHGTAWESDANEHWNECACGDKINKAAHSGGTATCTEKAVCAICNTAYGNTAAHSYGSEWKTDANNHWNECACGDKANKAAHTDSNNDGKCDTCEYQMSTTPDNPNPNPTPDPTPDPDPAPTPEDPSDDKDGLSTGAIVGIVIGSVAVAGIGGFSLLWFVIKKRSFADLIDVFKR